MFSCCGNRQLTTGVSEIKFRVLDPRSFDQKLIWDRFPAETIFVNTVKGQEYYYSWGELRVYPNFVLTRRIYNTGHENVIFTRRLEPDIYPFVYRYIRYNIRINISAIAKRLICSPEEVVMLLEEYGINACDNLACTNAPSIVPPAITDIEENEYRLSE